VKAKNGHKHGSGITMWRPPSGYFKHLMSAP